MIMTPLIQIRFSRSLFISMLAFMGISLALVMGSLYWMLSRSMDQEFSNEVRARQVEVGMLLNERFMGIGSKLGALALDNALRVNLMLGMDQMLEEQLAIQYAFPEGTRTLLFDHRTQQLYPRARSGDKRLAARLQSLALADSAQCQRFVALGDSERVSILSVPVMRRDERLGTLFALYDLARDASFWEHTAGLEAEGIYLWDGTGFLNLRTGQLRQVPIDCAPSSGTIPAAFPGMVVTDLKGFPGLSYVVSSKPLSARKRALIWMLGGLLVFVTILTLLMSTLLARRVANPLDTMVAQMASIAEEPFSRLLKTERIPYTEFRSLGQAFNQVLTRLAEVKGQEDRARNFLDTILNTAADPIFVKNERSELIIINDAFCDLLELPRDKLIGQSDESFRDALLAHKFLEVDARVLSGGGPCVSEVDIVSRTGKERLISTKKTLLVNPVTGERFIVGVVRDITASKRLEEELAHHRDHLAELVAERTAALSESNRELTHQIEERRRAEEERRAMEARLQRAQKMELIGTLAGGVAHDLNNILSGIVSYPELLLMELDQDSPLRKKVDIIHKAGLRAADLVQDLLTLTRRGVTVTTPVNLTTLIGDFFESPELAWVRSQHPGLTIRTSLEPGLLNIQGSDVHLTKTVLNLVINAAEAMPDGGQIEITVENRFLDRPVRGYDTVEPGDYVVLSVRDSGVGIAAEDLERIFEPFYTKKVMGRSGTGLGMAVVWGTVKDHRGYIDVLSEKGCGSTFTLYFPASAELIEQASVPHLDELKGAGEAIVVVDDVAQQRTIASDILTALNYSVVALPSGEAAVKYLREHLAELVVLDMIMDPGMDGLETYRQILACRPGQKAIIASGYAETERVRLAQQLGAGAYVKKPYRLELLGQAVREELRRPRPS